MLLFPGVIQSTSMHSSFKKWLDVASNIDYFIKALKRFFFFSLQLQDLLMTLQNSPYWIQFIQRNQIEIKIKIIVMEYSYLHLFRMFYFIFKKKIYIFFLRTRSINYLIEFTVYIKKSNLLWIITFYGCFCSSSYTFNQFFF